MNDLRRVALIDDDETAREICEAALTEFGGLKVTTFEGGAQALAELPSLNVDLILLDALMPGMSGIETLVMIKADAQLSKIPVVFLTGRADAANAKVYLDAGAIAVLPKPFDVLSLASDLRDIWRRLKPAA